MRTNINLWKTLAVVTTLSLSATFLASCTSKDMAIKSEKATIAKVQDRVMPALVRIFVISSAMNGGREHKTGGAGSGAIISKDGYIVTNHHVVGNAKKIWCTLSTKERVEAVLIGTDPLTDVAVIKLLPETMRKPVKEFPFVKWGNSDEIKAGDRVYALGSPGALAQSITSGIVSNPEIIMPSSSSFLLEGEDVGSIVRWIFHDAQIYHGNSGGPLVNHKGEIIGINEIGAASLGGAIPANTARHTVKLLMENNGTAPRSWTGLNIQKLLFNDNGANGALISWIEKDSPADKAGIQTGDKITAINGIEISYRYDEEFPYINRLLMNTNPGDKISLKILRDDKFLDKELTTELRGPVLGKQEEITELGVTAANITRYTGRRYKLKPNEGVIITGIRKGGAIDQAKPNLNSGNVITKINNTPVKNIKDINKVISEIIEDSSKDGKTAEVLITAKRNLDEILTVIPLSEIKENRPTPTARRAWFPGNVQILTVPLAEKLGLTGKRGVRITRVFPQLEKSGLLVGDILTQVNDKKIDAYDQAHVNVFNNIISSCSTIKPTTFNIIRDGKTQEILFTLPRRPKPAIEFPSYKNNFLGLKVRATTEEDKIINEINLKESNVIVDTTENGGWASLSGLSNGDIILSINGEKITTLDNFTKILEKNIKDEASSIIILVKRGYTKMFVEIRPMKK